MGHDHHVRDDKTSALIILAGKRVQIAIKHPSNDNNNRNDPEDETSTPSSSHSLQSLTFCLFFYSNYRGIGKEDLPCLRWTTSECIYNPSSYFLFSFRISNIFFSHLDAIYFSYRTERLYPRSFLQAELHTI